MQPVTSPPSPPLSWNRAFFSSHASLVTVGVLSSGEEDKRPALLPATIRHVRAPSTSHVGYNLSAAKPLAFRHYLEDCFAMNERFDGSAQMQQRVVQERLLLLHASNTTCRPKRRQTPLAYAAAAAAVMFACSLVRAAVAQQAEVSYSLGTSNLSVARGDLAATSLPNHGIAIFAGGYSGTFSFEWAQDALLFEKNVCEVCEGGVGGAWRVGHLSLSYALSRQLLLRCCKNRGHLQRYGGNLEHC